MDNIGNIVQKVIHDIVEKKGDPNKNIEFGWREILGEKESVHTKIEGIKNGVLLISVDSPAWLYQMKTRQNNILNKLQKNFPTIKRIQFKIGKMK